MVNWKFKLGEEVRIKGTDLTGTVLSKVEGMDEPQRYKLEISNGSRTEKSSWIDADRLTKVDPDG